MNDPAMTPVRALTIGLTAAIQANQPGVDRVGVALLAAETAAQALPHLPEGWELVDMTAVHRGLDDVDARLKALLGAQQILLGIRILEDGHAKNLGEAIRIAEDLDAVARLYPDVDA